MQSFLTEGSVSGSMVALIDNDPANFSLVAVENGIAVAPPFNRLQAAARSDIGLPDALIPFLSIFGKRKKRREYELLSLSPEGRYSILLDDAGNRGKGQSG